MAKYLLILLLLLTSCATLKILFGPPTFEHCGKVDVLEVYRLEGSALTCEEMLKVTTSAYEDLWTRGPGMLRETWRVEFMWGAIDITDPWGRTTYDKHLIQVKQLAPNTILHELGHAFMSENHSGGRSQHRKMCADEAWQKLEREWDIKPYCYLR